MYFVHIKLKNSLVEDDNREKFFHFIHQLWSQPNISFNKALKCAHCNSESIKNIKRILGRSIYKNVRELHALQFFLAFDHLIKNEPNSFINTSKYASSFQVHEDEIKDFDEKNV